MSNFNLNSKFMPCPIFGLEFPIEVNESYSPVLKDYWGTVMNDTIDWFVAVQNKALELGAEFVSVYFNSQEPEENKKSELLKKYRNILKKILVNSKIKIMIKLSSHANWDVEILNALVDVIDRELIISPVQAANYQDLLKLTSNSKFNHTFVLRTPIDINLTKELNILSIDTGLSPEQILIDPDMGCIGYGIDYGYSIIERICLARNSGDNMLNMPIIVYAGEESYKAKESKSNDFEPSWGDLVTRAKMWEISTASSLVVAGANIVVCWHPDALHTVKQQFCEVLCR